MKISRILLFFISMGLIAISNQVHAGWEFFFENKSGVKFYIDKTTIQKKNNIAKVWVRRELIEPVRNTLSIKELLIFDCSNNKWKVQDSYYYKNNNLESLRVSSTYDDHTLIDWNLITVNSFPSELIKIACKPTQ